MSGSLSEMNLPRFPLLTEEETRELLQKAREGDREAREKLINCHLKLVFNLVRRFENRGYDLEDLFQIGTIGLIKAIDKFDPAYEVRFSTYAVPMIVGEIRRFLRDDHPVKISRSLKETAYRIRETQERLAKELGRDPSVGELAEALSLSREEIVAAMEVLQAPESIHEKVYQDDGDPLYVLDQLARDEKEATWFDRIALKEVIRQLPPKQRQVIALRFFADRTQVQVAEAMGLSQVQVSRLERQALNTIRKLMSGREEE
ncbi:MAG: RNA polymerase sporulation sigma factor SigF [Clostridia bacterium]|nr:RNA polymerase sporulation sigma factor SigF [Clostridia bacterium]